MKTSVRLANNIMRQLRGWQVDRQDPPSLRDGYRYPGDLAIELAQAVLREEKSD